MMQRFLSQYRPRYIRSLTYMMQASEYYTHDYHAWFWRVRDFAHVEHRKKLVWTGKARMLFSALWVVAAALISALVFSHSVFVAVVVVVLYPYLVAYGAVCIVFLISLAQGPFEYFIIQRAKQKLGKHTGYKIAIAGSYGKTTMREILRTVLSAGKKVSAPPGSHNTPLAISAFIEKLTGDEEVLLFELGEYYPGDVKKLCDLVQPDMGVITGSNEAHLDRFKTLEATAHTIFELADALGAKPLYVNNESPRVAGAARDGDFRYSRVSVADWRVQNAVSDLQGTRFILVGPQTKLELNSKLLGLHQVGPLAAAAHIAHLLGLTPEQIATGVSATKQFEHRLEPKIDSGGVITLDDSYNGNPDGVTAVIDFIAGLSGRRVYVTPGLVEMGQRAELVHRAIGKQLASAGIEQVVLIRNSVTPWIAEGLTEAGYGGTVTWFDDALKAYAALPHMTVQGDVVVLQNDWPDQYA